MTKPFILLAGAGLLSVLLWWSLAARAGQGPGASDKTGQGPGASDKTGNGPGASEKTGQGPGASKQPAAGTPRPSAAGGQAKATFAGGCFWCMQPPFDKLPGVVSTTVGYTGGHKDNPTYEEVSAGGTGHKESIEVVYDPAKVSYQKLLDVFWHNIDPTDASGQFCDHGDQYRSVIFYHDDAQKRLAEQSRQALESSHALKAPIVTETVPASRFYPAEDYHQKYYQKSSLRYHFYRAGCGRDRRLDQLWGRHE
ncbi:MAG TPA: peptide-methionine (S)-S-oxide reductase MsrA [Thermoanaerobaculia bacterium]|nr:peptide-methionine (S)-S-oxide reductase MsrA [Thermoanaerobaculia bacterium]